MERAIKSRDVGRDGKHLNRFGYKAFYDEIEDFIQVTQGLRNKNGKEKDETLDTNKQGNIGGRVKRTNSCVKPLSHMWEPGRL